MKRLVRRNTRAIPLADVTALRPHVTRTIAVRVALGVAIAAAFAVAVVASREARGERTTLFSGRDSGVLVVDLSGSIGARPHARIGRTLRRLLRGGTRFGLVFFSDDAYEAIPPGTDPEELRPLLRFFTLPPAQGEAGRKRVFSGRPRPPEQRAPDTPWVALRGGTRISRGLKLARDMVRRDGSNAGVVLISDLDNSLFDMPPLTRTLEAYARDDIPLRVMGLSPAADDVGFFERVVGEDAIVSSAELAPPPRERRAAAVATSAAFPTVLAVAGLLLLLLVGANEHWCAALRWRGRR